MVADADLTESELRLVAAVTAGRPLDLGDCADPTIRAELLAELLSGTRRPDGDRMHRLALSGAQITGELYLADATVGRSLELIDCAFDTRPTLFGAKTKSIRLRQCRLPGLGLDYARVDGVVDLSRSAVTDRLDLRATTVEGDLICSSLRSSHCMVALDDARVGSLHFSDSTLDNPGHVALSAFNVHVSGTFNCARLMASGDVMLGGMQIDGAMLAMGASFHNADDIALLAGGVAVGQGMDLDRVDCVGELRLNTAKVEGMLSLTDASLKNPGGVALAANGLTTTGSLNANRLTVDGELRITGARIGGELSLYRAVVVNPNAVALDAENVSIAHNANLRMIGCTGTLDFANAELDGLLDLSGATLIRPTGHAFLGYGLTVKRDLLIENGAVARGTFDLSGARIDGALICIGATFHRPTGVAFDAHGAKVGQSVYLNQTYCVGVVGLSEAEIAGFLQLSYATLCNPSYVALHAEGLEVVGTVIATSLLCHGQCILSLAKLGSARFLGAAFINPDPKRFALQAFNLSVRHDLLCAGYLDGQRTVVFTTRGAVDLAGATIGGNVELGSARLDGGTTKSAKLAFGGHGMTVGHDVRCDPPLRAEGEFRLVNARVRGDVDLSGARLEHPEGKALNAEGATVDGDLLLGPPDDGTHGVHATGRVDLTGSRIGGHLSFAEVSFGTHDGTSLDFAYAQATTFRLLPATKPPGLVNLVNTKVDRLREDPAKWADTVRLRGFQYELLDNDTAGVRNRLRHWVASDEDAGYQPGVYDQLAAAYRRAGRIQAARQVGLAKQRRRRGELNWLGKTLNVAFAMTVGYGYRTWLAALWLVVMLAGGWLVYTLTYPAHLRPASDEPPQFEPLAYAFDVLIPVVDLGQQQAWLAEGPALVCSWLLILGGWVLTTAVVAGLTNALRRE